MPKVFAGQAFSTMLAGRCSGSMRISSAPSELAQIFQVAVDVSELVLEPGFLLDPEDRARLQILARIGNGRVAEAQRRRRIAAIGGAASIERDHRRFGKSPGVRRIVDLADAFGVARVLALKLYWSVMIRSRCRP